jgi:hypothetical protein
MQIANVFGFGAKKYFANSYRQGETVVWSRTYGSIMRHMMAFWEGEDNDPDSNISHISHAITGLVVLRDSMMQENWVDDRPAPSKLGWISKMNQKAKEMTK